MKTKYKKIGVTVVLLMFAFMACMAGKKSPVTLKSINGYPSGMIDEYCFRGGTSVIRGSVKNVDFNTIKLYSTDHFIAREVIHTISIADDGSFCATILLPHSLYISIDPFGDDVFLAVGDTLCIEAEGDKARYSGTGVTEEVNRVWPRLKRQFYGDFALSSPWKEADKSLMMRWNAEVVRQLDVAAMAINADTIDVLKRCSPQAADILKTNLLATPLHQLGYGFHMYRVALFNSDHRSDPNSVLSYKDYFSFLKDRESYLLDNPLMVFAAHDVVNALEYSAFVTITMLSNKLHVACANTDSKEMQQYKSEFILPEQYSETAHNQMLAVHGGRLLSIADYYKMACDTIHEKFGITSGSFIEQMSLLHHIAYDKDDEVNEELVNLKTEQLAGAIPLFTNRQVAFRAVKMYQELINSQRQALMAAAPVTKGDSIFHKIIDRYKGNVVFMDFWDLSCGSCRVEMLKQRDDVEFFKDKNVKFLYVCNEKNNPRNVADSFFEENHIAGEHIFISPDEWNYLAEKFQFQAIPFTLLIDKNGNIVERNAHPSRAKIESLLR